MKVHPRKMSPPSNSREDQVDDENIEKISPEEWQSPSRLKDPLFLSLVAIFVFFYIYLVHSIYLVPFTDKLSSSKLKPGWFFGLKQDLVDDQWRDFRQNIPLLAGGLTIYVLGSWAVRMLASSLDSAPNKTPNQQSRGESLLFLYHAGVGAGVQYYLHGNFVIFTFSVTIANYLVAKFFAHSKFLPVLTWALNLSVLVSVNYYWNWQRFLPGKLSAAHMLAWAIYFKMNFLRHISFNLDYYWALKKRPIPTKSAEDLFILQETHLDISSYNFIAYYAYVNYFPLYLAGPICSYNSFVHQMQYSLGRKSVLVLQQFRRVTTRNLVELPFIFLLIEIWTHLFHTSAHNKYVKVGIFSDDFTPAGRYVVIYLHLMFMYMKFLFIWRFFSLAAKLDQVVTWENMERCVSNNWTFSGFWRSWHGSFNKWIIRYIYVPCGGSKHIVFLGVPIFLFVGLWHELKIVWAAWAVFNCVFFVIEALILREFTSIKYQVYWKKWWWDYAVGFVGGCNVFLLFVANIAILHGFENTLTLLQLIFLQELDSWVFTALFLTGIAVNIMIEIRKWEKRNGIFKRT